MKPLGSNKSIQKFRVVLSIPEMDAILSALHKDMENLIENAELVGWISKQKRKAEFGIKEASHSSGPSNLSAKTEALVESVKGDAKKRAFDVYAKNHALDSSAADYVEQTEADYLMALEYKAEHVLECGSLNELEQEVLNEAMTKKLFGGL